jgi:hypothetical protein
MNKLFRFFVIVLLLGSTHIKAQTVETIIDNYEKARGGKEKLLSIQSISMEGSREMMGNEVAVKVTKVQGKLSRNEFEMGGTNGLMLLTEKEGWNYFPMRQQEPTKMGEEAVAAMQSELDIAGPLVNYAAKGYTATLVGKEAAADGTDCFKITLKPAAGRELTFWINSTNYLLVQATSSARGLGGGGRGRGTGGSGDAQAQGAKPIQMVLLYKDYKAVDGILFPHTIENKVLNGEDRGGGGTTFDKIDINKPVDAKLYKPE